MLARLYAPKGPRFELAASIPRGYWVFGVVCIPLIAGVAVALAVRGDWTRVVVWVVSMLIGAAIAYHVLKVLVHPILNSVDLASKRLIVRSFGSVVQIPYAKVASTLPGQIHQRSFWDWPRVPDRSQPHVDVALRSRFWFYGNGVGWPVKTLHLALDRPDDFIKELELAKERALHS